jgi:putative endonuclease
MSGHRSAGPAIDGRRERGRRGEEAAARWYVRAGYRIVARNWRCSGGEIDLVAVDPVTAVVVICEVKTRSSARFGRPEEAVTPAKQRRLRRLAALWLSQQRSHGTPTRSVRFDVAAVWDEAGDLVVDVLQDAF